MENTDVTATPAETRNVDGTAVGACEGREEGHQTDFPRQGPPLTAQGEENQCADKRFFKSEEDVGGARD